MLTHSMLRRILNYFRRLTSPTLVIHPGRVITLSKDQLGVRQWRDAEITGDDFEATGLEDASNETLMRICEDYWLYLNQPRFEEIKDAVERANAIFDEGFSAESTQRRKTYTCATNELGARGSEILDWARQQLAHPDYEARAMAAWWIGQLGNRDQIGSDVEDVIDELCTLANRPVGEECKEIEANVAAIRAIGKIGHRKGIAVLRYILFSKQWQDEDIQWVAADALGKLVGRSFMMCSDSAQSARAWLEINFDSAAS